MDARVKDFRAQVEDLLVKLNTPDVRFNVGIFVFDSQSLEGQHFGIGCPACMGNAVIEAANRGELKHNEKSATHKL